MCIIHIIWAGVHRFPAECPAARLCFGGDMKAAMVVTAGEAPVYGNFSDPASSPGKRLVRVSAAAISHVTRSRASGTHYSHAGALPFVPGLDGTGVTEDGRRVYFIMP